MLDKNRQEVQLQLSPDLLNRVDTWATENAASRELAVVELLKLGLAAKQQVLGRQRARAEMLAENQIDRMEDVTATSAQQKDRKRSLTRGPPIFREIRRDQTEDKG